MRTRVFCLFIIPILSLLLTGCASKHEPVAMSDPCPLENEFISQWGAFLDKVAFVEATELVYLKKRRSPTGEFTIQRVIIPLHSLLEKNDQNNIFGVIAMTREPQNLLEIQEVDDNVFQFRVPQGLRLHLGQRQFAIDAHSTCEMQGGQPKRLIVTGSQEAEDYEKSVFIKIEYEWGKRHQAWLPIQIRAHCSIHHGNGIERIIYEEWRLVKTF